MTARQSAKYEGLAATMKIIVCLKEAVDTRLNSGYGQAPEALFQKGLSHRLDPPSLTALAEALQMKAAHSAIQIALIGLGPQSLEAHLGMGMAAGADRSFRIWQTGFERLSTYQKAKILSRAIALQKPDLILTGARSSDNGSGICGPLIAAWLSIPCVSEASSLQLVAEQSVVNVSRKAGKALRECVQAALPALVTVAANDKKLSYCSLENLIAGSQKEIIGLSGEDIGMTPHEIENDPAQISGLLFPSPRPKIVPYDSTLPAAERILALIRGGITQRRAARLAGDTDEMIDQLIKLLTAK